MRRRQIALVEFGHGEPPQELLSFMPGGPGQWTPEGFAAFLRARAAWRATHREPLPGLPARERCALAALEISAQLIDAETEGSRRPRVD